MKTYTRSINGHDDGFPQALVDPDDQPVQPLSGWPPGPTGRAALMEVLDEFAVTPAGRRVVHGWFQVELLADALQVIAGDPGADPLRLSPRSLAGAFGTEALDEVRGSTDDLALLPEMVGAFVPYAHALRGVGGADTAASLAVIESCRSAFVRATVTSGPVGTGEPWRRRYDTWQPPPPPSPWEVLALEVGGQDALDALTAEPLPDEPAALSEVPEDVLERVEEALAVADPVVERVFGIEGAHCCPAAAHRRRRRRSRDLSAEGSHRHDRRGRLPGRRPGQSPGPAAGPDAGQGGHRAVRSGQRAVEPSAVVADRGHRSPLLVGGDEAEQPALPDLATADRAGGVPRPAACGGGHRPGG